MADGERHISSFIEQNENEIALALEMSFRYGKGERQRQLDYLATVSEETGLDIIGLEPSELMKNKKVRTTLSKLFTGKHGGQEGFEDIPDAASFVEDDLTITFRWDPDDWPENQP